jgi:hypothetical protein
MKYLILLCFVSLQGCACLQGPCQFAPTLNPHVIADRMRQMNAIAAEHKAACDANPNCVAQRAAQQAEAKARIARDNDEFDAQMAAIHQRTEDVHSASDSIVANAMARNARDTAAVTAATPSPAQVPQQPARQPDPLAPNSAMKAEAAQARKGAGTDLCPNEISDIGCANRLEWLKEQAGAQH